MPPFLNVNSAPSAELTQVFFNTSLDDLLCFTSVAGFVVRLVGLTFGVFFPNTLSVAFFAAFLFPDLYPSLFPW